jgi:peptidyl-prolyl cis-trans isomerase SurA
MLKLTRLFTSLAVAAVISGAPTGLIAQNAFAPAIVVNDQVITGYELAQRKRMVELLRAPGNPDTVAREQLIDDRLKLQAAYDAGIRPSEEELLEGMAEFAGRANMTREEFVKAIGSAGVDEQTFRDFVNAGLSWRLLVQQRFTARANVSEAEVDRALANQGGTGSNVRVLLSEIIMPVPPGQEQAVRERADRISQLDSTTAFSAQARRFSATPSRGNGGRLPWRNLSELPAQLQPFILGLSQGEVTDPLPLQGAVALFQLRDIEELPYKAPEVGAIEYAAYYMPGGRSPETLAQARVLKGKVDRCDDLYGIAKGQPAEVLERGTLAPNEIPTDIAYELSKLDAGEVSTALTRANGQTLVFLMMCGRTNKVTEEQNREEVTLGLRNKRLGAQAEGFLSQLRADATIITKQ